SGLVYLFDAANPSDTSHPVDGATVTAGGRTATTGATGQFSFTLSAGTYTVSVSKSGYAAASLSRAVTAGQTTQAKVGLTASGGADHKPPDLAIIFPTAGATLDLAVITVTGTASDDTGAVPEASVSLNGGTPGPATVS